MATLEQSQSVSISDLLDESVIDANMEADSREEVFEQLVSLLEDSGKLRDPEATLEAIRERENILSTGIGNGVAIPHAKTSTVDKLTAAFGRVPDGVDFKCLGLRRLRTLWIRSGTGKVLAKESSHRSVYVGPCG
ncbi:MAG: PTS sugar transporter subunit IIA [bacterium]